MSEYEIKTLEESENLGKFELSLLYPNSSVLPLVMR